MSNLLFFDTETTGLPSSYTDHTAPDCPHIVQLAAILTDDQNNELGRMCAIVRPDLRGLRIEETAQDGDMQTTEPPFRYFRTLRPSFLIPPEASNIHGITQDIALTVGLPLLRVLLPFERLVSKTDIHIAHNIKFDRLMVKAAYHRLNLSHPLPDTWNCTMLMSQKVMGGRWPKLAKAYQHFFGEELAGAHDAMIDCEACRRIYFEIRKLAEEEALEKL